MLKNGCPYFRITGIVVLSFRTIRFSTLLKYTPSLSASARDRRNGVRVSRMWYVTILIGLVIRTVPSNPFGFWPPKLMLVFLSV